MPETKKPTAVLCYVEGNCAFFTTQPLFEQWGEDWGRVPYEHNAERPYEHTSDHLYKYEIVKVYFEADLEAPCNLARGNSEYSVRDINSLKIPWLQKWDWRHDCSLAQIWAGTSLDKFKELVRSVGGKIYVLEP